MSGSRPRARDESFRELCDSCGVGFWHLDADDRTVYMNPALVELLELNAREEAIGRHYSEFVTPATAERISAEGVQRGAGRSSRYEGELVGRRGGRHTVVFSGTPLFDAAGKLSGRVATVTDISDVRRAEAALLERERQLRSVFQASMDAIGVAHQGMHVLINRAYVQMFGYDHQDELLGRPVIDLVAPSARHSVVEHIKNRAIRPDGLSQYVSRGLRKNGSEFPMEARVSTYEQEGQRYTVVILRDLTERQQLQERLRRAETMDALGRLAGGVAHDFNNLLMVIMGASELILERPDDVALVRSNAEIIHSTGERAGAFTRQLLAVSRKQVVDPKVVSVNAVLSEMLDMLQRLLGSGITLRVERERELLPVRMDPGQLEQVIMNLCINARDAIGTLGTITITTRNVCFDEAEAHALELTAGRYVRLSVRDSGHGIEEAVLGRLFEPFFTTKPRGKGAGLGLSTVYGIVKQSGGHVLASSEPGQGSLFRVYLPAVDAPLSVATPPSDPAPAAHAGSVLLVEDDTTVRDLLARYLRGAGYQVEAVDGAPHALTRLDHGPGGFDVVLTDVLMPVMTGVQLAHELERRHPKLPVLFMSGYVADDTVSADERRPHWAFLNKPFSLPQLLTKLQALLVQQGPNEGKS